MNFKWKYFKSKTSSVSPSHLAVCRVHSEERLTVHIYFCRLASSQLYDRYIRWVVSFVSIYLCNSSFVFGLVQINESAATKELAQYVNSGYYFLTSSNILVCWIRKITVMAEQVMGMVLSVGFEPTTSPLPRECYYHWATTANPFWWNVYIIHAKW